MEDLYKATPGGCAASFHRRQPCQNHFKGIVIWAFARCSCSVAANHSALSRPTLGFKSRHEHHPPLSYSIKTRAQEPILSVFKFTVRRHTLMTYWKTHLLCRSVGFGLIFGTGRSSYFPSIRLYAKGPYPRSTSARY